MKDIYWVIGLFLFSMTISSCKKDDLQGTDFVSVERSVHDGYWVYEAIQENGQRMYFREIDETHVSVENKNVFYFMGYWSGDNEQCEYRGNIIIPETLTYEGETFVVSEIGEYAFYAQDKIKIESVTIPKTITRIRRGAFNGYSGENLVIPETVKQIDEWAFSCLQNQTFTIPQGINSLSFRLFSDSKLISIVIPENIEYVDVGVFDGCFYLENITFANSRTKIQAFGRCASLKSFDIPSLSDTLFDYFLSELHIEDIVIPKSVEYIGNHVLDRCEELQSVTCLSETPPTVGVFLQECPNLQAIYVPEQSVAAYKNAEGWRDFEQYITAVRK